MKIRIMGTSEQHKQFNSLLKELEVSNKLQIISTSKEYKNRNSVESRVYYEIKVRYYKTSYVVIFWYF